jgi:hypothetical protein
MSKSNATEVDVLRANLKGTDPAWRSGANRYLAFHTADPGEAGNQTTSETNYTGYARIPVPVADWTEAGSVFSNTNLLQFAQCTGAPQDLTHVSIGTALSGAGQILYSGPLSATLSIANLIRPQFEPGAITVTED